MSLKVLSIMYVIDVIWSAGSAAITLHGFCELFWIFQPLSDTGRNLYYNYQKPLRVWRHNENGLLNWKLFTLGLALLDFSKKRREQKFC